MKSTYKTYRSLWFAVFSFGLLLSTSLAYSLDAGFSDSFEDGFEQYWETRCGGGYPTQGVIEITTDHVRTGTQAVFIDQPYNGGAHALFHVFPNGFQGVLSIWQFFHDPVTNNDPSAGQTAATEFTVRGFDGYVERSYSLGGNSYLDNHDGDGDGNQGDTDIWVSGQAHGGGTERQGY